MWFDKIAQGLSSPQIVNDSKTPSGRVHVGSLRGVLIHDAIHRALKHHGIESTYTYGIDDYDPLDGLPADAGPDLKQYMGYPLCNIPAPDDSQATDLADHYIAEFLGIFDELGVDAQIYRMRDVYRSGKFNEAIDVILEKADVVRDVYAQVSKAERRPNWYPFQVICENCGKIGSSEVTDYDGKEVTYHCKKDLVSWAEGCGHLGKTSPFDGKGKLPWKLEWVAKWHTFGITVEGAGKDHCTKGGSRDVAVRCLNAIFGEKPPLNVPYEFFLVSGAKMSSSKGIGTAARDMADFLPAEVLRFLMTRTPPKRTVNFSTDFEYIVKLFNEHDKLVEAGIAGTASEEQLQTLRAVEVRPDTSAYHPVGFQLLSALLQLPHLDIEEEIEKRSPAANNPGQTADSLGKRIASAKYWLENYARDEDRVQLQETLPASAQDLTASQKAFLNLLGKNFPAEALTDDDYQRFIFDTARLTPIGQKEAFAAIYRVLLNQEQGPKGGSLLSYLDKDFLLKRFGEITGDTTVFWRESAITPDQLSAWLEKQRDKITGLQTEQLENNDVQAVEVRVNLSDGKIHLWRVLLKEKTDAGEIQNLLAQYS